MTVCCKARWFEECYKGIRVTYAVLGQRYQHEKCTKKVSLIVNLLHSFMLRCIKNILCKTCKAQSISIYLGQIKLTRFLKITVWGYELILLRIRAIVRLLWTRKRIFGSPKKRQITNFLKLISLNFLCISYILAYYEKSTRNVLTSK